MKPLVLVFLMFFASLESWANTNKPHLVQGCRILDQQGLPLQQFPGEMCLFFEDGSFASATISGLTYFDQADTPRWTIPGHFHHQLNISQDGKRILAISSTTVQRQGVPVRMDTLMVISREGKVLHQTQMDEMLQQKKLPELRWPTSEVIVQVTGAATELSHINSIYEIPRIQRSGPWGAFSEGDIIVNGLDQGMFVLSPDLSRIKYHTVFNTSWGHRVHDLQVTERGTFLFFNNVHSASSEQDQFSAIQELDPHSGRIIFVFTAQPRSIFYSAYCGGVQELDSDRLMFSDAFNTTYLYSRSKKTVLAALRGTHLANGIPVVVQQVRAYDLSQFLDHRKK